MKHIKWIASTGLVAVLAIAYVAANGSQERQRHGRSGMTGNPAGQIFQLFDSDQNGEITRAELAQSDAAFDALDRNQDGVVSRADLPQRAERRREHRGGRLAAAIARAADADNSGDVTRAEWESLIAGIETDSDGAIVPGSLHQALGMERPEGAGSNADGKHAHGRTPPTTDDLIALFSRLDKDQSGVLEAGELKREPRGRDRGEVRGQRMESRNPLARADLDQSGDVTADEWQTLFGKLDRNGDGSLSDDELGPGRPGHEMRRDARGKRPM